MTTNHTGAAPDATEHLRRITADPALTRFLDWPCDFDLGRRDPVERLALPSGLPLHPIAGCGAGGTYFLCGATETTADRPVLYADSEGGATLLGENLAEALTLLISFPYWRDLDAGHPAAELESALREDHPTLDTARTTALTALSLTPLPLPEALTHLRTMATRTTPDFLPTSEEHGERYDPLLTPPDSRP
ncbi:hypothetical protein GT204_20445 [Streptomyces sp. SID4919]|uniref:hypothetical protein n=1 Tax=unclassified Streptomyces TaxID=2593676 RepID=UPI0011827B24|nr:MULTISPECIES: hypothetical protein [unclassified Streptomyces]MYY11211.1 hypothetical protein [Streptomyces sp. SID4919]